MEENKRKTIILTFIGALTLLFVVIGGTFAYFQIVNTNEGSTSTDFNAQTDTLNKYGTPLLTKKSDLYINLSASDMAYSKGGTSYWATEKKETQEKNYEEERKNHIISTASIERPDSEDAEEDAYLSCTSELTITIDGTMKDVLQTGDGTLYLGTKSNDGNKGSIEPESFDLAELVSKQESGENKATVNYTITGFTSVDVTADIEIVNREAIQNVLAGTDIQITITNNNLSCSVKEKEDKAYMKNINDVLFPDKGMGGSKCPYENIYFVDNIPERESIENIGTIDFVDLSDTESGTPEGSVVAWSIKKDYRVEKFNYAIVESLGNVDAEDLYIGSKSEIYATNLKQFFGNMYNLKTINRLDLLNTSETTDMSKMFQGSINLLNLDLSTFNTTQVTDMSHMFSRGDAMGGSFKPTIIFPKVFGSAAADMSSMFYGYEGDTLDLSTFDTSKVTDMSYMFSEYKGTTLDLSTFDTSQVTNMSSMFSDCSNLTTLDLSSFTFDNVTTEGGYDAGNNSTFYNVPSSCQVNIKRSQQQLFEDKFPLSTEEYDGNRTFTPKYVD